MVKRPRKRWTHADNTEMWKRFAAGESVAEIANALRWHHVTVNERIRRAGGVAERSRRRNTNHLTQGERETISRELACGSSIRSIARTLGRSASTVCREVNRNGGRDDYRATDAECVAWIRATRPKDWKLEKEYRLRQVVAARLRRQWSPEQIAGWLKRKYPRNSRMQVSHETIYKSLYVQTKGILEEELLFELRGKQYRRRSKKAARRAPSSFLLGAPSIRKRPASAEDRAVPGHWEGDLLMGDQKSCIATLVERHSRYTMLVQLNNKGSETVVKAIGKHIRKLPQELRKSLTWDRGSEMAQHRKFTFETDVKVYFCDPASPWQRGTNENTNRLLRQYMPKGQSLADVTQPYLNAVARRLNERPRKTLGF